MKLLFTLVIAFLTTQATNGQSLYTRTFGNSKNNPIIFLHGGPGYNSVNFEATTAQVLADRGYFVIVYDRRGEGRSKDATAKFTFNETFADLKDIYQQYKLTTSTLMGHSFGGIVATLFAEANPTMVQSIILVGAPVSLQATFKNILTKSKSIYQQKNDQVNLNYITMLEKMDTASLEYSSYCFGHAMQNGFYSPQNPTAEAKNIYATFRTDTLLVKYASQMSYQAPMGFWKNENYTTIDLTKNLQRLLKHRMKIYGLYGKDDGLYSGEQIADLQQLIGASNVNYFENCSHNIFIDQQSKFADAVVGWIK